MKVIYMHHAERNIGENHNDPKLRQLEDITETGVQEAELLAKRLQNQISCDLDNMHHSIL